MTNILLIVAVLPALLLIAYVYHKDSVEKEPIKLLIILTVLGGAVVVPAAFLEMIGINILAEFVMPETTIYSIIYCFLIIGCVEEGGKYLIIKWKAWNHPDFNFRFDAVVYAVCVGLGFAIVENMLYVYQGGLSTALVRTFTAIPAHAINAVFMGYYVGQAKLCNRYGEYRMERSNLRKAFWVPVFLHGFYDFCVYQGGIISTIVFIGFVILMDVMAIRKIKRFSEYDVEV